VPAQPPDSTAAIRPDLSRFDNRSYHPGRNRLWQAAWFFLGLPLLRCTMLPSSAVRRGLLRLFGARIGKGVVIKPGVRVKYPWRLDIGDFTWIGEDCWIDNLDQVTIGDNACLSQGVYLCTGNHDWKDPAFALRTAPIRIGAGAWVAARASLAPGVSVGECAIAGFGAVVTREIPPFEIHAGNPAKPVANRATAGFASSRPV